MIVLGNLGIIGMIAAGSFTIGRYGAALVTVWKTAAHGLETIAEISAILERIAEIGQIRNLKPTKVAMRRFCVLNIFKFVSLNKFTNLDFIKKCKYY